MERPGWNDRLGRLAEDHAARVIEAGGLRVLARRYRVAGGEIDLVARDGPTLVFVEVKARTGTGFGPPAAAVGRRKRRRLLTAARQYLHREGHRGPCRFDVVAIESRNGRLRSEWFRDAFRV